MYNSLIRSLFDYCHVIVSTSTQRITNDIQKIQNKILKIVKKFPIKTSIDTIHKQLNIIKLDARLKQLFTQFIMRKKRDDLLFDELRAYALESSNSGPVQKFLSPFDIIKDQLTAPLNVT